MSGRHHRREKKCRYCWEDAQWSLEDEPCLDRLDIDKVLMLRVMKIMNTLSSKGSHCPIVLGTGVWVQEQEERAHTKGIWGEKQ